jgi:hypothetical protein
MSLCYSLSILDISGNLYFGVWKMKGRLQTQKEDCTTPINWVSSRQFSKGGDQATRSDRGSLSSAAATMANGMVREVDRAIGALSTLVLGVGLLVVRSWRCLLPLTTCRGNFLFISIGAATRAVPKCPRQPGQVGALRPGRRRQGRLLPVRGERRALCPAGGAD